MSDTPSTPKNDVLFNAPPPERLPSINAAVADAVAKMSPDAKAALIGVANKSGANAVFVLRTDHGWTADMWIGKTWKGDLDYGAEIKKEWTW